MCRGAAGTGEGGRAADAGEDGRTGNTGEVTGGREGTGDC